MVWVPSPLTAAFSQSCISPEVSTLEAPDDSVLVEEPEEPELLPLLPLRRGATPPPSRHATPRPPRSAERRDTPAISTGDIFRANMAEGTEIGKQAQAYMDRGEFVPDSVTNAMVKARLAAPDTAKGFLLDGYPRSVEQAHVLRDMLLDLGTSIDVVLEIQVDEDEVVERMLKRAQEQHRTDDTEPVMRHRLEVYHQQTEPVATYYVDQDLLEVVDGRGTIDEVTERIFAILDSVAK